MHRRFTSLSFIIGLFFVLISLVLLVGYFVSSLLSASINLYAGIAFIVFGVIMITITPEEETSDS